MHKDRDKNLLERGFTLVELLIVVVILGILAGIVVFAVGGLSSDAQNNACATEERTIETAIEAYLAKNPNVTRDSIDDYSALTGGANPLLKDDPSARFTVSNGALTAVGDCA